MRPPAWGQCLLWTTLGFPSAAPLPCQWRPLPGHPLPEAGGGLTPPGSSTNGDCGSLLRPHGWFQPLTGLRSSDPSNKPRNGFWADHAHFTDDETKPSVAEWLPQSHTVSSRAEMGALRIRLQSPRAVLLDHVALGRQEAEALSPQHWGVSRPLSSTPTAHRGQSAYFRIPSAHHPRTCVQRNTHTEKQSHTYTLRLGHKPPAPGTACRKPSAAQAFFTSAFS